MASLWDRLIPAEKEVSTAKRVDNFKVIFIGNVSSGKTSIIQHYVVGKFTDHVDSTIGASFTCTERSNDKSIAKLHIWDTAGQERYRGIISIYYRGADVAIIVCDLTNSVTIDAMDNWIKDFKDRTNNPDALIILVGNKIDLIGDRNEYIERFEQLSDEVTIINENQKNPILEEVGKKYGCHVIYTSAKHGTNLNEIFNYIYRALKDSIPFDVKTKMNLANNEKNTSIISKWCNLL